MTLSQLLILANIGYKQCDYIHFASPEYGVELEAAITQLNHACSIHVATWVRMQSLHALEYRHKITVWGVAVSGMLRLITVELTSEPPNNAPGSHIIDNVEVI